MRRKGLYGFSFGKAFDLQRHPCLRLGHIDEDHCNFIRPGAKRVELTGADDTYGLLGSAYKSAAGDEIAMVFINMAETEARVSLKIEGLPEGKAIKTFTPHVTSENDGLKAYPPVDAGAGYVVPGRSAVTLAGILERIP